MMLRCHQTVAVALVLTFCGRDANSFTAPTKSCQKTSRQLRQVPNHFLSCEAKSTDQGSDNTAQFNSPGGLSRREILSNTFHGAIGLLPFVSIATTAMTVAPESAVADQQKEPSIVPPKEVFRRLRQVPTFTIVDGTGKPYMILDKGAQQATGYFFTSMEGAVAVLEDAKKTASESGYGGTWAGATITTVPLDIAMQLSLSKRSRKAQNDITFQSIYDVIPTAAGIDDALKVDKSGIYGQRGRVPLFFFDGLELPTQNGDSAMEKGVPIYFNKNDLLNEWNKQHPGQDPPKVKIFELLETFRAMIKPGGKDESVKNLVFVPNKDSVEVAQELKSRAKPESAYRLNEMIMVGGK